VQQSLTFARYVPVTQSLVTDAARVRSLLAAEHP